MTGLAETRGRGLLGRDVFCPLCARPCRRWPTANLDIGQQMLIARLLRQLACELGVAVLAALHDLTLASPVLRSPSVACRGLHRR